MAGAGDNGGVYHQLDGSQRLLLDAMTTQMQRLLNRNKEELYRRIAKSSLFTLCHTLISSGDYNLMIYNH